MSALEQFLNKFKSFELKIGESESWVVSLRPQQLTLGSMVIAAKSGAVALSDLSVLQFQDLQKSFNLTEHIGRNLLKCDQMNYLCLMMVDKHLHFHVFPRYQQSQEFLGQVWVDLEWPKPLSLGGGEKTSMELLKSLQSELLDKLKSEPVDHIK